MLLTVVFQILGVLAVVYMLLCLSRIIISWLPGQNAGPIGNALVALTDPWLKLFRNIKILTIGKFDFSPIAALTILVVAADLFNLVAKAQRISLGLVLALIVGALWSAIAFLITIFALFAALRILAWYARWNSVHPFWRVIDAFLNPLLFNINRIIYGKRHVTYIAGLWTGFALLLFIRIGAAILINLLISLLGHMPI